MYKSDVHEILAQKSKREWSTVELEVEEAPTHSASWPGIGQGQITANASDAQLR